MAEGKSSEVSTGVQIPVPDTSPSVKVEPQAETVKPTEQNQSEIEETLIASGHIIQGAMEKGWSSASMTEELKQAGDNVSNAIEAAKQQKNGDEVVVDGVKVKAKWDSKTGTGIVIKDGKPVEVEQRIEDVLEVLKNIKISSSPNITPEVKQAATKQTEVIEAYLKDIISFDDEDIYH